MNFKKLFQYIVLLAIVASAGVGAWLLLKDQKGPEITLSPSEGRINKDVQLKISIHDQQSGIKSLIVSVRKNTNSRVIFEQQWTTKPRTETQTITLKDIALKEGAFEIIVKATDASYAAFGKGNSITREFPFRFDSIPPNVSVNTMPPNIRRGGTGLIVYTANEELENTGVQVGDAFFPAYKQENNTYICFFAYPYFLAPEEYAPRLVATDLAGNTTERGVAINALNKKLKNDIIRLPDSFLNRKMVQFEKTFPGKMTQLERFLKVNRDLRVANRAALGSIGRQTEPEMLWKGRFIALPNSARKAGFAEHRTYTYRGKPVDEQYHLGLDLASLRHAPIPAANRGRVIFADNMGIYGNVVIVDHGLGLQTLYSHMSEFAVTPGRFVSQGEILGKTGATGMAGGDHLHFGVILSGMPVNPMEWLDARWIRHNITSKLQ